MLYQNQIPNLPQTQKEKLRVKEKHIAGHNTLSFSFFYAKKNAAAIPGTMPAGLRLLTKTNKTGGFGGESALRKTYLCFTYTICRKKYKMKHIFFKKSSKKSGMQREL